MEAQAKKKSTFPSVGELENLWKLVWNQEKINDCGLHPR